MKSQRLEKIPAGRRKVVEKRLRVLSEVLQAKREALGLTQEELSEKLGVSVMTLQFIEQRRRYPSLPLLFYLCEELGLDVRIG